MSDNTKVLGVQFTDATGKDKTLHFLAPTGKHAGKEATIIEHAFAGAADENAAIRQLLVFGFKQVDAADTVKAERTFGVKLPAIAEAA
jgi:hypothetical protein